jgi:arylsulfatase A-like enzyme
LTYEGVAPGFNPACLLLESAEPWLDHLAARGYGRLSVDEVYAGALGDPAPFAAEDSETAFLTDRFLDFLQARRPADPWLVHLSYIKPHPPWVAAAPYNAMYERGDLPKPRRAPTIEAEAARHPYLQALLEKPFGGWLGRHVPHPAALSDALAAEIRAIYLGLVSELDRQLGRVFEALAATGELDRTLVVLTADHGEMLGDGWQLGKTGFRPEAFHVPLVIRHPERRKPGHVVDAFTEHVDLLPTILDALGIAVPRQSDGRSLLPLLAGETPAGWRDAAVYEHDFRDLEPGPHHLPSMLGLEPDSCGIAVRRGRDRLYAHFGGLPPLLWASDASGAIMPIDDPATLAAEAQALLSHRMTKAERRLTGCLLTEAGLLGGFDPL